MAFVCVAKATEIAPGQIREVQLEGTTIAVANVGGRFHAINNTCLHRGGPLGQGSLQGNVVTCPWHGWSFDVTSGKTTHNQAAGVPCYPVELRGEDVYVDIGLLPA
jgi:nitrite reductase (NADH) small subunit